MSIVFSFCDNILDAADIYDLNADMLEGAGLSVSDGIWMTLQRRYLDNELVIGKNESNEIVSFYLFHIVDNLCTNMVVFVRLDYRGTGLSTEMCDFVLPTLVQRGVTKFEILSVPRADVEGLQASRNMVKVEERTINGIVYDVYQKEIT
jgi:hypothetical protein